MPAADPARCRTDAAWSSGVNRQAVVLLLLTLAFGGGARGQVATTTRLVTLFTNLEAEMMTAVQQRQPAAERLLSPDFQVWTPQPPGAPVPRAEWLRSAPTQLQSVLV